ncbi:MAG TPA: hypothetical protein VEF34_16425 [Syntrophobacteraceae bacterium]|nr:hypothetical protein [Syntrophobacteraceae bacterium]
MTEKNKRSKARTTGSSFLESLCIAVCLELLSWLPLLLSELNVIDASKGIARIILVLHWPAIVVSVVISELIGLRPASALFFIPLVEILPLLAAVFPVIVLRNRSHKRLSVSS